MSHFPSSNHFISEGSSNRYLKNIYNIFSLFYNTNLLRRLSDRYFKFRYPGLVSNFVTQPLCTLQASANGSIEFPFCGKMEVSFGRRKIISPTAPSNFPFAERRKYLLGGEKLSRQRLHRTSRLQKDESIFWEEENQQIISPTKIQQSLLQIQISCTCIRVCYTTSESRYKPLPTAPSNFAFAEKRKYRPVEGKMAYRVLCWPDLSLRGMLAWNVDYNGTRGRPFIRPRLSSAGTGPLCPGF